MKRIYFILPCLVVAAFAGNHRHWDASHDERATYSREDFTDPYRNRDGRKEAEDDLAHGKLRLVGYGLPVHWIGEYREVMQRDYGVQYEAIAGCVVSEGLMRYAGAYNKLMEAKITARHGERVFAEAQAKAEALFAERHRPPPAQKK